MWVGQGVKQGVCLDGCDGHLRKERRLRWVNKGVQEGDRPDLMERNNRQVSQSRSEEMMVSGHHVMQEDEKQKHRLRQS